MVLLVLDFKCRCKYLPACIVSSIKSPHHQSQIPLAFRPPRCLEPSEPNREREQKDTKKIARRDLTGSDLISSRQFSLELQEKRSVQPWCGLLQYERKKCHNESEIK